MSLTVGLPLQVSSVTKTYGSARVLSEVTFSAQPGCVTAFLGPNGAGKTTTLRIAAGLSRPDAGEVTYGGRQLDSFALPARAVGFALDAGCFHPGRSVVETLRLAGLIIGAARHEARDMVERVGLGSVARRRVGALSLGMRQRLAIGHALLGAPGILVLDEPTNGLDVEGANWVKSLLVESARRGGTVLVSSHLLRELQAFAEHVVMIDRGRIVADGPLTDFTRTRQCSVRAADNAALLAALAQRGIEVEVVGEVMMADCQTTVVGQVARDHGIALLHLNDSDAGALERRFMGLTHGEYTAVGRP